MEETILNTSKPSIKSNTNLKSNTNENIKNDINKEILKNLRPKTLLPKSNYDLTITRKLMSSILGVSIGTVVNLEEQNIIKPKKVRHGGIEVVTYNVLDVQSAFKKYGKSFKQKPDAEIISVFSQKGGVGKSAFTQHLGSMLSLVGKVLVIDLDAQSDATILFGGETHYPDLVIEEDLKPTIADLMNWDLEDGGYGPYDNLELSKVVKKISTTIDLIPSDLDLGEINYSLNRLNLKPRTSSEGVQDPGELHMIKEVIEKVKDQYDYILLDCPPNIETCNVSALFASNRVLVPLELEAKSLTIMRRNVSFLERLSSLHAGFEWDKILVVPNKFRRENIKIKALAAIEDQYENSETVTLSQVVIPNSSLVDKCSDAKSPVISATSRYGGNIKSSIAPAKEFTNYFWAIMHEILDLPLERLIFGNEEGRGE
ncbi:MAG: cellulose biosynthesis protein BcsQ [Thermoproteota archaeon]|jgi:cellulose biosynthesis protein BcsQ